MPKLSAVLAEAAGSSESLATKLSKDFVGTKYTVKVVGDHLSITIPENKDGFEVTFETKVSGTEDDISMSWFRGQKFKSLASAMKAIQSDVLAQRDGMD